jgi:conjugal transfer mating pair stabilization protein TraG
MTVEVYTIGGGDLIQNVFNAVATVFNDAKGISAITSLAVLFGGVCSLFEFSRSRDVTRLIKWAGLYVLVTSLMLYPKTTVVIEDRTGIDIKPRFVDHVPLSLALCAGITSRIGIGMAEMIETVFHLPDDMSYNKTGMLMGSKLVLAAKHFQITDPDFSETLNEFMQQCVFYDILLQKYTVQDLIHTDNPWEFIKNHTSQARAFPLNGQITVCNVGAGKLDKIWQTTINNAASIYGGQIFGTKTAATTLLSHLQDGYGFLTGVSRQGDEILKTNLLANALEQGLARNGANANAPAALQAYMDTKSELQTRETLDQTGRQAGLWLQQLKNIVEAVLYSAFIFIYFLSYFPFGGAIIRNYLFGLFYLQTLAPMYAIINFAANVYAQNRSMAFLESDTTGGMLSMANVSGIAQANADAMALAGYLLWPITIGGAIMLFRGMPGAIQSMGQLLGGVSQNTSSHVVGESIGGNISAGNANFGNRSMFNTNANHWDSNMRYSAGAATIQTGTGSSFTLTSGGNEVLNNNGALSNLGVSAQVTNSLRSAASHQAQTSLNSAMNKTHAAGEQYSAAFRKIDDFNQSKGNSLNSGDSYNHSETTGENHSLHQVSQLIQSWAKDHHVSHERAAQLFGQIYADMKVGGGGLLKFGGGASGGISGNLRSSFGGLYGEAERYALDNHFSDVVDSAKREARESHFRTSVDQGSRSANSVTSSFDKGDNYRTEAASQFSKSESYSSLASMSQEQAASISGNYTQEFYEWMRHQSSPASQYGQGTMSRSAIDNMAVHDTALLQSYADRFIDGKMGGSFDLFSESHHLNDNGKSIQAAYQQNNHAISGESQVHDKYESFSQQVQSHQSNAMPSINSGIKEDVNGSIDAHKRELSKAQHTITADSQSLEKQVDDKVKGQVFESLNGVKGAEKWLKEHSPFTSKEEV